MKLVKQKPKTKKGRVITFYIRQLFLVGIFLSIFIFWPKAEIAFEIPKVSFVLRWIEVLALFIFFALSGLKKERIDTVLVVLVLMYLGVAILSAVLGVDFKKSLSGNYYRMDGLVTFFHLVTLFFIITIFSTRKWITDFIKVISVSSITLSGISIVQWLSNLVGLSRFGTWDNGYGHVFGNPNFLAGYLIVTLAFTAYRANVHKNILWTLGLFVQLVGILLTASWVGYFAIIIFLTIWFYLKIKSFRLVVVTVGVLTFIFFGIKFLSFLGSLETPTSINPESRQRIFMKSMLSIGKRPVLGYGWANFDKAFESVDYPIRMEKDVYVDKAHSSFLEVLVTTGILGVLLYFAIIIKTIINFYNFEHRLGRFLLIAFIGLVVHMQTNVISISEELLFWILVGFSAKSTFNYGKNV